METFFYKFARFICEVYFRLFHRASFTGLENIPKSGPLIIATNHCSYLDPPLLSVVSKVRVLAFMAKKELFNNFFFGLLIKNLAAYPVDRDAAGDKQAYLETLKILKDGRAVLIFPEGTRTLDGELRDFQSGFARLAMSVPDCQILPARIRGSYEAYEGGRKIPRFCKITVNVGEPLDLSAFQTEKNKKQKADLITQELRREIEKL